jgi:hypothetical protein
MRLMEDITDKSLGNTKDWIDFNEGGWNHSSDCLDLTGCVLLKLPYYLLAVNECPPGYIQQIRRGVIDPTFGT